MVDVKIMWKCISSCIIGWLFLHEQSDCLVLYFLLFVFFLVECLLHYQNIFCSAAHHAHFTLIFPAFSPLIYYCYREEKRMNFQNTFLALLGLTVWNLSLLCLSVYRFILERTIFSTAPVQPRFHCGWICNSKTFEKL